MKTYLIKTKGSGLFMFVVLLLCAAFGITGVDAVFADGAPAGATGMAQPEGSDGVQGEGYVTLDQAMKDSPNLITRAIHSEVIKVSPYDYTTRSLLAKNFKIKKKTKDHKVAVYSATSKPIRTAVATLYTEGENQQAAIDFGADNSLFYIGQNVFFPSIAGYKADGVTPSGRCFFGNVVSFDSNKKPIIVAQNGVKVSSTLNCIPTLAATTVALRGLRTGTEKQIRTDQFNVLPTDREYYVQKNLIEFGVSGWYNSASKEVKWDDRDIMEMAIAEKTRTEMPDFWLGTGMSGSLNNKHTDEQDDLAYWHEGVWTQAGREFDFNGTIDIESIIDFASYVFTGNRSSNEKYLTMGAELSAEFQKVIFAHPHMLGETFRDKELNINWTAINFFGGKRILFGDDPSLTDIGMSNCGFLIDHKYGFEYNYGMEVLPIDNKQLRVSDTKGQVMIEENCYILANHESHCRVIF